MNETGKEAAPLKRGRRPRHLTPGRESILKSALPAFGMFGFEGVSLREISSEAKVDVALIAHAFGSKADLWRAALEQTAQELSLYGALFETLDDDLPIRHRLELLIDWFTERCVEKPYLELMILRESLFQGERLQLVIEVLLRPLYEKVKHLLMEAVRAKLIRANSPEQAFFLLFGTIASQVGSRGALETLAGRSYPDLTQEVQRSMKATFLAVAAS